MSDYNKSTNFTAKDTLPSGNSGKIVKGTELDIEFTNISSAIASKADSNSPTFTGTPAAPTATTGSNTTQIATTAFVKTAVDNVASAPSLVTAAFSIVESGGYLYIKAGSTNIARIDTSGNIIVKGNVTAYGTI